MKLYPMGEEKKEAGWITSSTESKLLGKQIALGYVKRPFYRAGVQLDALEDPIGSVVLRVEVADLPFTPPAALSS